MVDHLERHNANVARAMHQLGAESTEAFEDGARQGGGVHQRALPRRGDLHQERLRGAQPGRQHPGLARPGPAGRCRRRGRHHRDGAPLQHRAVAAADRAHRRDAALVRADRRRPARPVQHRRPDHRAHQGRLADLGLQHARHDQPGRRDRRAGRTRSARSSSSTPRRRRRSCRSTWSPRVPTSLAFTGHKVVGPTGIGVLWGRREVLDAAAAVPRRRRDDRDRDDGERSTYAGIPHKFEAGTPPIVEAVGLGAAVDYLGHLGMDATSTPTSRPSRPTPSRAWPPSPA